MGLIRTAVERLARNRSFVRRLPEEFGHARVWVSPDAALSFLRPGKAAFAPDLLTFARLFVRPGDQVWDVGANVGVFSVAAAVKSGPSGGVVAFEPDPFLANLLYQTVLLADDGRSTINVVPVAISSGCSLVRFQIARRGRASNAIVGAGRSQMQGVREIRIVPAMTLDVMLEEFPAPSIIKIDVEGAELDVLRGAERVLGEVKPILFIEVGSQAIDPVTATLKRAGYSLYQIRGSRVFPCERCVFDTLALPPGSFLGDYIPDQV